MIPGFKFKHRCKKNTEGAYLNNICENDTGKFVADGSDYAKLLKKCNGKEKRFRDKKFPANSDSLVGFGPNKDTDAGELEIFMAKEWSTTGEYQKMWDEGDPEPYPFCTGGFQPQDIKQEGTRDCYFIAAVSSVCRIPELTERIFVKHEISRYAIYCLALFLNGAWESVVLDSRFPITNWGKGFLNPWAMATNRDN